MIPVWETVRKTKFVHSFSGDGILAYLCPANRCETTQFCISEFNIYDIKNKKKSCFPIKKYERFSECTL